MKQERLPACPRPQEFERVCFVVLQVLARRQPLEKVPNMPGKALKMWLVPATHSMRSIRKLHQLPGRAGKQMRRKIGCVGDVRSAAMVHALWKWVFLP